MRYYLSTDVPTRLPNGYSHDEQHKQIPFAEVLRLINALELTPEDTATAKAKLKQPGQHLVLNDTQKIFTTS